MPIHDEAEAEFADWYVSRAREDDTIFGPLAEAYGKAPGLIARLALVFEHLWWCVSFDEAPSLIGGDAVRAAIHLRESYIKPMMERTYADASLPEADRLAMTLARWIAKHRPKVVNTRVIQREAKLPGLRDAAKIELAFNRLTEAGWLFPPSRTGKVGRTKRDFKVNPAVWESLNGAI